MEYPIRVLHIVRRLEQGGIQNFLINVFKNIDRSKIQFDFLVSEEGFFDEEVEKLGGHLYKIPYITEVGVKKYQKELSNFLCNHKEYKIIHSHLNQLSGIPLEEAKKCNIPIRIAHAHTTRNTNNLIAKIYKSILQSKINKNATELFACSLKAAKWMFKGESGRAEIIYNGIDLEKFSYSENIRKKIRNYLKISDNTLVFGHIGRLSPVKNHSFLIDIFQEFLKWNNECILILIGEGEQRDNIKKKIEKKGLEDKIYLLGNKKNAYEYYSAFDLFVFPSKFEGLGISLIEAQINGLQCYTSDTIPIEAKITDKLEFISIKKNAKYWAKRIHDSYRKDNNRKNTIINNKNEYSIREVSSFLENKYIELYNNCK